MYAEVKGSSIENRIKDQAQAELSGALMYFSLAKAAREHGLDEAADQFTEIAGEHASQATTYAFLTGRYPFEEEEFWKFIKGLSKAEESGDELIREFARQIEESGFADAADTVRTFAAQHKHHSEVTRELVERYAPESIKEYAGKRYVCSICGYVYEGDIENEPDDYTCPLCGMPKAVFNEDNR